MLVKSLNTELFNNTIPVSMATVLRFISAIVSLSGSSAELIVRYHHHDNVNLFTLSSRTYSMKAHIGYKYSGVAMNFFWAFFFSRGGGVWKKFVRLRTQHFFTLIL